MSEKFCFKCNRTISLTEHPSGLVFNNEHFLCEDCAQTTPEEDLAIWSRSVMQKPQSGMPIALWLIHEQNKDKTMMSIKK
ncbi:MAG: hypothetical protein JW771_01320 [Candidatus Thermoplasmatota archaeon]|nr:hypothetical protein [Candidatus Thermoplasmatota archaeon]